MEPLERVRHEVETRFGDKVGFDAPGRAVNVAVHAEAGDVLEHRGEQGVRDFLAGKTRRGGQQTTNNERKETDSMAARLRTLKGEAKKRPARGGLAADKAQDEAKAPAKRVRKAKAVKTVVADTSEKKSKCGKTELFGFSLSSILRRMGKEGLGTAHTVAILTARGVKCSAATAASILRDGRKGEYGEPAPLTKEQFKELSASAPVPVEG